MKPVIICVGEPARAVVYGHIDSDHMPDAGEKVRIKNARMVLRWDAECGGLFGLAANGPAGDTRITASVQEVACVVGQSLSVTESAAKKIDAWEPWK